MNLAKSRTRRREEDHINRLPDEILNIIFDRVCDMNCLFNCFLVSKRFASLVPNTRFVSVQQQGIYDKKMSRMDYVLDLFCRSERAIYPSLGPHYHSVFQYDRCYCDEKRLSSIGNFLKQFRCLDTLYWKLPLMGGLPQSNPDYVTWEIGFKNSHIPTHFLFLSMDVFNDADGNTLRNNYFDQAGLDFSKFIYGVFCKLWFDIRRVFREKDVMVKKLVCVDSIGRGKIVVRNDGVEEETNEYQLKWQFWDVPVLRLPESGGVMKKVRLAVMKAVVRGHGGDGGVISGADGEKTVLWEAAREIMKQNPTCTSLQKSKYLFLPS